VHIITKAATIPTICFFIRPPPANSTFVSHS
jgi:hypothetical protein